MDSSAPVLRRQTEVRLVTGAVKRIDAKKKQVFGEVYVPFTVEQGKPYPLEIINRDVDTWATFMAPESLEALAHLYLPTCSKVDVMHDRRATSAGKPVESFIARPGDPDFALGSWVLAVRVNDDEWHRVESGELNAFSFDINAARRSHLVRVVGIGRTVCLDGVMEHPYIPRSVMIRGEATIRLDELLDATPNTVSLVDRGGNRREFETRAAGLLPDAHMQDMAVLLRCGFAYESLRDLEPLLLASMAEDAMHAYAVARRSVAVPAELPPPAADPAVPAPAEVAPIVRASDDDGEWITINGTHVMIGKDGKIAAGPDHMVGHHPSEIPSAPPREKTAGEKATARDHFANALKTHEAAQKACTTADKAVATAMRAGREPDRERKAADVAFRNLQKATHALEAAARNHPDSREALKQLHEHKAKLDAAGHDARMMTGAIDRMGRLADHNDKMAALAAEAEKPKGLFGKLAALGARLRDAVTAKVASVRSGISSAVKVLSSKEGRAHVVDHVRSVLAKQASETKAMASTIGKMARGQAVTDAEKAQAGKQFGTLAKAALIAALPFAAKAMVAKGAIKLAGAHAVPVEKFLARVAGHIAKKATAKLLARHLRAAVLRGDLDDEGAVMALLDELLDSLEEPGDDDLAELLAQCLDPDDAADEARADGVGTEHGEDGRFVSAGGGANGDGTEADALRVADGKMRAAAQVYYQAAVASQEGKGTQAGRRRALQALVDVAVEHPDPARAGALLGEAMRPPSGGVTSAHIATIAPLERLAAALAKKGAGDPRAMDYVVAASRIKPRAKRSPDANHDSAPLSTPSEVPVSLPARALPNEQRDVVPYQETPASTVTVWDATTAEMHMRQWASSDGSGDPATLDMAKLAEGFARVNGDPSQLESLELPHHDVEDGKLVVSREGVFAACEALDGARTGTPMDLGDDEAGTRLHLAKHCHDFDTKAPWEKDEEQRDVDGNGHNHGEGGRYAPKDEGGGEGQSTLEKHGFAINSAAAGHASMDHEELDAHVAHVMKGGGASPSDKDIATAGKNLAKLHQVGEGLKVHDATIAANQKDQHNALGDSLSAKPPRHEDDTPQKNVGAFHVAGTVKDGDGSQVGRFQHHVEAEEYPTRGGDIDGKSTVHAHIEVDAAHPRAKEAGEAMLAGAKGLAHDASAGLRLTQGSRESLTAAGVDVSSVKRGVLRRALSVVLAALGMGGDEELELEIVRDDVPPVGFDGLPPAALELPPMDPAEAERAIREEMGDDDDDGGGGDDAGGGDDEEERDADPTQTPDLASPVVSAPLHVELTAPAVLAPAMDLVAPPVVAPVELQAPVVMAPCMEDGAPAVAQRDVDGSGANHGDDGKFAPKDAGGEGTRPDADKALHDALHSARTAGKDARMAKAGVKLANRISDDTPADKARIATETAKADVAYQAHHAALKSVATVADAHPSEKAAKNIIAAHMESDAKTGTALKNLPAHTHLATPNG